MELPLLDVLLLLIAGAAGGYLAGLVGVGGGIIYGPVLLYYFKATGIQDPLLTPLTLGTSLLCVFLAALSGSVSQRGTGFVDWKAAIATGLVASVTTVLTARLLTTQPWYDQRVFQVVLGSLLVWIILRMLWPRKKPVADSAAEDSEYNIALVVGIGILVGILVAASGIGGGVLMIPLFTGVLKLPLKRAMATSLASILVVSFTGIMTYFFLGIHEPMSIGRLGYVDIYRGLLLGTPAIVFARFGVRKAQRVDVKYIRYTFCTVALIVAVKLLYDGLL